MREMAVGNGKGKMDLGEVSQSFGEIEKTGGCRVVNGL